MARLPALLVGTVILSSISCRAEPDASSTASTAATTSGSTSAAASTGSTPSATSASAALTASAATESLEHCDVAQTYKDNLGATPKESRAATAALLRKWTEACRWRAFEKECPKRCDETLTDLLIGASGNEEATKIRTERLKRNDAALKRGETLATQVREIIKHANAIKSQPRDADCAARMGNDFRAIEALRKEIDTALGEVPIGLVSWKATLGLAKNCLDCAPDRELCKDMNEGFKSDEETLGDWRKMVEAERKAL